MHSITFELETITPMFMYGADQNRAELRPPSFKGMMRFWWRAMRADDDIEKLAEQEALLFGGTGEKQGRSKVIIRIVQNANKEPKELRKEQEQFPGMTYLLYSTFMPPKDGQKRTCFHPNTRFALELSSNDEHALQQAEAAFWLAMNLGGFGMRARRGGGNLVVQACEIKPENLIDKEELTCWYIPKTDLYASLQTGFQKARSLIQQNETGTEKYSNLLGLRIWIGDGTQIQNTPQEAWKKALESIGKPFMAFRCRKSPDYQRMVDFLLGNENNTDLERVNFGLPIVGRFNHNRDVKDRRYSITPVIHGEEVRRASPLIIKLLKQGQTYFPMFILLSGMFLPEDATLKLKEAGKGGRKPEQQNFHNSNIFQEFIHVLTTEYAFHEVIL